MSWIHVVEPCPIDTCDKLHVQLGPVFHNELLFHFYSTLNYLMMLNTVITFIFSFNSTSFLHWSRLKVVFNFLVYIRGYKCMLNYTGWQYQSIQLEINTYVISSSSLIGTLVTFHFSNLLPETVYHLCIFSPCWGTYLIY